MRKVFSISISQEAKAIGKMLAKSDRRTFSAQVETLIAEEAERRGIKSKIARLGRKKTAAA